MQEPARIAVDLGTESCLVSLLQWGPAGPSVKVVHRFSNAPVRRLHTTRWRLDSILAGLEEGLRKAAQAAPEGIASIGVDGWGVDYVRLAPDGSPLGDPFCYRDERTVAAKDAADRRIAPFELYQRTGVLPNRSNTIYQLLADQDADIDAHAPWVTLPEYVLHWLGGRRVAEYTQATHTGLVDPKTGDWDRELFGMLDLALDAAPPIVPSGAIIGRLQGPLASLAAFRETQLIAPACHETASAVAGIPASLDTAIYICSGAWSILGAPIPAPVVTRDAFDGRFSNLGVVGGGLCLQTLTSGVWLLNQCMESWRTEGRAWAMDDLIAQAACVGFPGIIDLDSEPLLFDSGMPERINHELWVRRLGSIPDVAGNEPVFVRVILESLASRYAAAVVSLERVLDCKLNRILLLGGTSTNQLLVELTAHRTGLPVVAGPAESSTIGNLAIQLAATESDGTPLRAESVRKCAQRLLHP